MKSSYVIALRLFNTRLKHDETEGRFDGSFQNLDFFSREFDITIYFSAQMTNIVLSYNDKNKFYVHESKSFKTCSKNAKCILESEASF